jgi:3-methyl-2-oxobutanoate hydroxymethyltransferase
LADTHPEEPRERKITAPIVVGRKAEGRPIVMVTAYDVTFARLIDAVDVDIVLVGDSLGMVVQGRRNTLEVTLEEMIYHTRCVQRGVRWAQVVLDLPFMSYQLGPAAALASAGRAVKEGRAEAVKLEGGAAVVDSVRAIVGAGIPVMGHVGLTPQSVHAFGGFRVQGRDAAGAARVREDALRLQDAGCYAIVLEGIPSDLAGEITSALEIPTIGIGAGVGCDGQVLVMHDLLGLDDAFRPRFVARYAELAAPIREAVAAFARDVRARRFPGPEHSFSAIPGGEGGERRRRGYGPG